MNINYIMQCYAHRLNIIQSNKKKSLNDSHLQSITLQYYYLTDFINSIESYLNHINRLGKDVDILFHSILINKQCPNIQVYFKTTVVEIIQSKSSKQKNIKNENEFK